MVNPRSPKELYEKAALDRRRAADWLLPFMADDKPKFCTKEEFRRVAMETLGVSQTSFDMAWIMAIEESDRQDWYEPLRGKRRPS